MERFERRGEFERAVELPAIDQLGAPSTVAVHAIPAKTASDVPALQPYDFAKVDDKLLIVNPHHMMIAEVITG